MLPFLRKILRLIRVYYDKILDEMFVHDYYFNTKLESKYYISTGDVYGSRYLHKDGTVHSKCGPANFWDIEEEAQEFLDRCRGKLEFITLDDMMI